MNLFLVLLLQSALMLPPRTAMENPAVVSPIPKNFRKDYDKLWARFVSGKEDLKVVKDLDKLLQKQSKLDPAWIIEGYLSLHQGNDSVARERFTKAVAVNPTNRIAMYYLAELAFAYGDYSRAATTYAQLSSMSPNYPEIETKRQKAFLLATENLLRAAAKAEAESRLPEAEEYYRQALSLAPGEPAVHGRLADLLQKQNKKEQADAERKIAEELGPHRPAPARRADAPRTADLEELGRWGSDIEVFYSIRDAEAVTREQLAVLIVRYFPQITEIEQRSQIVTDIEDSSARSEIQTIIGLGVIDSRPNRRFDPSAPVTRGELARALSRVSRLIGLSGKDASPIDAPDVAPSNIIYSDVQLVLGSGLMSLEDSGSFDVSGRVSGRQAVRSTDRLLRGFQQVQR